MKQKLFTLLTMLIIGIGSTWAQTTPVVVTFGNNTGIDGLTTDAFNFAGQQNISRTLSDGTTLSFTPTNKKFWAGNDGNIEGSWTNSVAIADINTELATSTSFTAALFSASSSLKYLATGDGTSTSSLTLTFNNKQEGDRITLYASLARRGNSLSNFSASGLDGLKIQYAVFGGSGFSDTQAFSQRTGSSNDSPVTIVKITGKLSSSKTLTMSSTSTKNGWQMIAYMFNYYPHVTGSVTNNNKNLGTIHVTRGLSLRGEAKTLDIVTQTGTNPHSVYQNATNQTFTICAGQDIKVSYNQVGWMHAYMYIDYNNDGQFSPYTIQESGIPTEGSELVSYTYYKGKNSKGESANDSNSGTSLPVFTIPSDLAQGTYRARYKLDWDFLDPYGSDSSNRTSNYTITNRGVIIDFIIKVEPKYTVTADTKLSEIPDYDSYKTIYVNEDVTLTVDVDDFDLAYISGAGNIILDANAPLSDITASGSLTVESGGSLTATGEMRSISATNNGTMSGTTLYGPITLGEGSTTTLSDATPFHDNSTTACTITVNGNATLNLTATTAKLHKPITIAADKTFTIDCASKTVNLDVVPTFGTDSKINFKNATINYNNSIRSLANYTFTSCTAQFTETGTEYAAGGFTITNVPSSVTVKVKKYGTTDYVTVTPEDGTATFSHDVEVSGSAAWLDYTFNETTLATNKPVSAITYVPNRGNAGSGKTLTIDNSNTSAVSYNADGTFKVRYTPYCSVTWPENYTVAVSGNFPDVENGCLVAFGTKSANYLALIRGANSNEIKLVKGKGDNTYTNIQTMAAENATAAAHLVVFTKQGNVFKVYCDGVNVATTEYDQTLGGGLQVGSIHGGYANTGVVSVVDNSLTDDQKNAVFCNAIRVYNYIISDDQMEDLKREFPYLSQGGNYTRIISADANLDAEDAWYNVDEKTNTNLPTNNVVEEVTYYPDIVITTTAAYTLTVNANMDSRNIEFNGAGKLTIASDGEHNISIYGSVTANGPISVKYGETDFSAVPVSIGESGSIEFDFSYYNFSDVSTSTDYPVTGLTSNYGSKVTALYPSDDYHTYSLAFNGTTNSYYLTVGPSVALKRKQAIDLVTPYYNGSYVGTGLGKYTISLDETSYATLDDFENAVGEWSSLGDCVEPAITFHTVPTGFYRIKGYSNNYITSNTAGSNASMNGTASANNIIYYSASKNLIFFGSGYGLYNTHTVAPAGSSLNAYTFSEGAQLGHYYIKSNAAGIATYCYDNTADGTKLDRNTDPVTSGSYQTDWTLEEVTTTTLTLNNGGDGYYYATLCLPFDVTLNAAAAYTLTMNSSKTGLTLSEAMSEISAGTPVFIRHNEGTLTATIGTGYATTPSTSTSLTGCYVSTDVDANTVYTLGKENGHIGFYKYSGTSIAANRAYVSSSVVDEVSARGFALDFGELTGISNVESQKESNIIYDMQGRRVQKAGKGLYIVNGKKVLY